jgi:hypothetical protein
MKGRRTAQLLERWNAGDTLTDAELTELIEGLRFIFEFSSESKLSPLTVYYGNSVEQLERCQEARKDRKRA